MRRTTKNAKIPTRKKENDTDEGFCNARLTLFGLRRFLTHTGMKDRKENFFDQ